MPVIIPAGYGQATINFTHPAYTDGDAATVFGFESTGVLDPAASAAAIGAIWSDEVMPQADDSLTLTTVRVITATTAAEEPVNDAGGLALSMLPPNCAPLVRKLTGARGRRAQGRMFPPGMLPSADVGEQGTMTSTRLFTLQTLWTNVLTELQTAGISMVVLQNDEGETPPITPPPPVTALQVDGRIATQRRRLRR